MMNAERLVLRDRAGCMWLLGLMFLIGGSLVAALLLGFGTGPRLTGWGLLLAALVSTAHIGTGVWLLTSTPNIVVRLSRDRPVLHIAKYWFLIRRERSIHLDEMAGLTLRQEKDSDGDPVYLLELRLRDGSELRLHSVALHARPEIEKAVEAMRVWSSNKLSIRTRTEV